MDKIEDLKSMDLKEKFDEIWNLNQNGDKEMYYFKFVGVVESGISPDTIFEKYNEYIISKSELQNGKYTSKTDRIVDIYDFLAKEMYKQSFSPPQVRNADRDAYLYGV